MTKQIDSYWQNNPAEYFDIFTDSQIKYYDTLASFYRAGDDKILDYGCGTGNLIKFLPKDTIVTLFDINKSTTEIANQRFRNRNINPLFDLKDLPSHHFNLAYLSLVLTCIKNISEIENAFSKIYQSLVPGGRFILGTTHPCFRNQQFSYFHTGFTDKKYNYFDEGNEFKVYLHDRDKSTEFSDYHWSLEFTVNLLLKSGFKILYLEEVYDKGTKSNESYPPYMIIECQKNNQRK